MHATLDPGGKRKEECAAVQGGKGDLTHGVARPGDEGIHMISVSLECYV